MISRMFEKQSKYLRGQQMERLILSKKVEIGFTEAAVFSLGVKEKWDIIRHKWGR